MLDEFLKELDINGKKKKTQNLYRSILKAANEYKPLHEWNKNDVNNYILFLKKEKYNTSTIEMNKIILKKFFKWCKKGKIIEHLQVKLPKSNLKRENILTVEDITKMIEATGSPMYKALIAFLFESGARISEVLQLTVKDTQETDQGMLISVIDIKTEKGYRQSIYPYSTGYIRNHISYSGLSKEDRLFSIGKTQVWRMLKQIGKKAGIEKPISAHKFRHAQATDMVLRNYQESTIRKKLGWTEDSRMIARYLHVVDDDVINATLEKNGINITKKSLTNIPIAEPLKLANASLQLKKSQDEIEELKKDNEELKNELEDTNKTITKACSTIEDLLKDFEGLKKESVVSNLLLALVYKGNIKPEEIIGLAEKMNADPAVVFHIKEAFEDPKIIEPIMEELKEAIPNIEKPPKKRPEKYNQN